MRNVRGPWVRTLLLILFTAGVALAHFALPRGNHGLYFAHLGLAVLSLMVIHAGASWFGLRGGVATAGAAALPYFVHLGRGWPGHFWEDGNQIAIVVIYMIVGGISGILSDMEKRDFERRANFHLRAQRSAMIQGLSALVQESSPREKATSKHRGNVAGLSVEIGKRMGLTAEQVEDLRLAALNHDEGDTEFSNDIPLHPGGTKPREIEGMRRRPKTEAKILRSLPGADHIAQILLCHHERLDGSGYPRGLMGGEIPIESRILAVAEVFCALQEDQPHSGEEPYAAQQALAYLEERKGTEFDPEAVLLVSYLSGQRRPSGVLYQPYANLAANGH